MELTLPAPHKPDEKSREYVERMSSYGIPQEDISKVVGIDLKTLRKHYREELDTAETKANTKVAGMLFKNCMEGKEASIFFWLKTRAGFRETIQTENKNIAIISEKPMTNEEWKSKYTESSEEK